MNIRKPELVVLSDFHLGTYGCHAEELATYLESIHPKTLILNGDVIDFWYLHWRYWPKSHMRVLELLIAKASQGVKVFYLTGNHDDLMRRFSDLSLGNFCLTDKLVLTLGDKPYWFFHGDVLDTTIGDTKFLTKLGGWDYDRLILINRLVNKFLHFIGRPRLSLSKIVRANSKEAVQHLTRFENLIAELAAEKNYYGVICGHVHAPVIKTLYSEKHDKKVLYLNSGDWVEHLTSLEFENGKWALLDFSVPLQKIEKLHVVNEVTELNSQV